MCKALYCIVLRKHLLPRLRRKSGASCKIFSPAADLRVLVCASACAIRAYRSILSIVCSICIKKDEYNILLTNVAFLPVTIFIGRGRKYFRADFKFFSFFCFLLFSFFLSFFCTFLFAFFCHSFVPFICIHFTILLFPLFTFIYSFFLLFSFTCSAFSRFFIRKCF